MKKIQSFLVRKKVLLLGISLLLVFGFFVFKNSQNENYTIITPIYGILSESVRATGEVTSVTNLNLAFNKQGVVNSIKVAVGDKVIRGQTLATLESASDYAEVTRARANLLGAQAKLKKIIEGSSNEEINLARVSLDNAKSELENIINTQNTLTQNAYNKLLNSAPEALPVDTSWSTLVAPTISGTYALPQEGFLQIRVYATGNGLMFSLSGVATGEGAVNTVSPQPLGDTGLYIVFSSTTNLAGSAWIMNFPNPKASDYLANKNAYDSAIRNQSSAVASATSLVKQREAELEVKLASARASDIDLARADVLSAEAGLQKAQAVYEDSIIRAPLAGTITRIDVKYGEAVNAGKTVLSLEDIDNLYIETPVNESNISKVKVGQTVLVTVDALGSERFFSGTVSHIDPSALVTDGVVNYEIKISLANKEPDIRSGMNSEVKIIIQEKPNVLSIPKAIIKYQNSLAYVTKISDGKRGKTEDVFVTLGDEGDGNLIEVLSGITQNDKLIEVSK